MAFHDIVLHACDESGTASPCPENSLSAALSTASQSQQRARRWDLRIKGEHKGFRISEALGGAMHRKEFCI